MFWNGNCIRLRRGSRAGGDESTSLHDAIQRASVDHQILDDREGAKAKWLDCDGRAIAKFSHVKLTHRAWVIRPVCFAINGERAGTANAFAAIRVERDRFLAAAQQIFVQDVEHFEERRVRRNIMHFVINEFSA